MKKLMFLFVSLLTLTMTSCGDDDEDGVIAPLEDRYYICRPGGSYIPAEGGKVKIKWEAVPVPATYEFYSSSWVVGEGYEADYKKYVDGDDTSSSRWGYIFVASWPGEKIETSTEEGIISGGWFTVEYVDDPSPIFGTHQEIEVTLSANTTGERRHLRITLSCHDIADAYIYQDCEETEE